MPASARGPPSGRVPLWYGGHAEVTLRRVVKWGDGWMPLAYGPGEEARAAFDQLAPLAEEAGRDPATIGIDTRVSAPPATRPSGARCAVLEIPAASPT